MAGAILLTWLALGPSPAPLLEPVTVTATRREASVFDTPAAVSVRGDPGPAPGVNLTEWLAGVPGLVARERQNQAQDTQVSLRGYGARAGFGMRGLRIVVDGIPATQPDGQSQWSHANLASAGRAEVLRGPFSVLHGNASGGVIQVFSAEPGEGDGVGLSASGSSRDQRLAARALGEWQGLAYSVGLSRQRSEGLRAQSAATRQSFNARLQWRDAEGGPGLALVLNHFDSPEAEDPLGLSRAQFEADPFQTTPQALAFDTRKRVRQTQAGLTWEHAWSQRFSMRALAYGGRREVQQFLAVPVAAQANALQSGGVVDLASDYAGAELRLDGRHALAGRDLDWSLGLASEGLDQHRRGYENFLGSRLGVRGALRRNEDNRVASLDPFAQLQWRLAPRWSLLAGARRSRVEFSSRDHYVSVANPDDSGDTVFSRWTPMAALQFRASPRLHLHASVGTGFETPTLAELAYRPDGQSGLNLDLRPARSRHLEFGLKWRPTPGWRADLALFRIGTRDELVVASNVAGRATFRNAGTTTRRGVELELEAPLSDTLQLGASLSLLDVAVSAPLRTLPGLPRRQAWLRLDWRPRDGWLGFVEARGISSVAVDDAGSDRAAGHGLLDLGLERSFSSQDREASAFLRLDNVLDRRHAGSVIVNEGNGRHFEPGLPRTLWLGLEGRWDPLESTCRHASLSIL